MKANPTTNAALVARFGLAVFGPEWGAALARLTGTNERTVRRIKAAAEAGRDYPAARGVLVALHAALARLAAETAPHAAAADQDQP